MRFLAVFCALFFFTSLSIADGSKVFLPDNYSIGYSYDGYTKQSSGLWYNGHTYANLIEYKTKLYDSCGCRYYWQTYYYWKPAQVQVNNIITPPNVNAPDFWERIAEVPRAREELQARLQALAQLGYAGGNDQRYSSSYRAENYPASTYYEYRQERLASPVDLVLMDAQQGRTAEQLVKAIEKSNEGRQAVTRIIAQESGRAKMVDAQSAAIDRLSIAYERLLRSGQPAVERIEIKGGINPPQRMPRVGDASRFAPIENKYKCNACHVREEQSFRLEQFDSLSALEKAKVRKRLYHVGKGHMPKDGPMLTDEEMALFD